jgi:DNA-directed RNA polymerase subunit RPC12/RpoP
MSEEYIRKADAVKECGEWYVEEGTEEGFIGTVSQMLDMFSPADVVQVVHSEWIYHMSFGVCKKCGYEYEWKGTDAKNYCPNCGAKMDAKGEE